MPLGSSKNRSKSPKFDQRSETVTCGAGRVEDVEGLVGLHRHAWMRNGLLQSGVPGDVDVPVQVGDVDVLPLEYHALLRLVRRAVDGGV